MRADEPLAEAGRRALRTQYFTMLAHEDGTRRGEDAEALHDMRVATRRQRQIFRIIAHHYKRTAIRAFRDGLRTLARYLGTVRDFDVLISAAEEYQRSEPDMDAVLESVLDAWRTQRSSARADLVAHLDGADYRAFTADYGTFLSSTGVGVKKSVSADSPQPHLVRDIAPGEIWNHYGNIRAYDAVLGTASLETLHALRIEGKRLRYLLEFFAYVLGPDVDDVIKPLIALQDHLGELHDSQVAIALLQEFLGRSEHASVQAETAASIQRYLAMRQVRLRTLRDTLDRPWRRVARKRYRRRLACMVADL